MVLLIGLPTCGKVKEQKIFKMRKKGTTKKHPTLEGRKP